MSELREVAFRPLWPYQQRYHEELIKFKPIICIYGLKVNLMPFSLTRQNHSTMNTIREAINLFGGVH